MADREKEGNKKIKKLDYLENEKRFLNTMKSIFHNSLRAVI